MKQLLALLDSPGDLVSTSAPWEGAYYDHRIQAVALGNFSYEAQDVLAGLERFGLRYVRSADVLPALYQDFCSSVEYIDLHEYESLWHELLRIAEDQTIEDSAIIFDIKRRERRGEKPFEIRYRPNPEADRAPELFGDVAHTGWFLRNRVGDEPVHGPIERNGITFYEMRRTLVVLTDRPLSEIDEDLCAIASAYAKPLVICRRPTAPDVGSPAPAGRPFLLTSSFEALHDAVSTYLHFPILQRTDNLSSSYVVGRFLRTFVDPNIGEPISYGPAGARLYETPCAQVLVLPEGLSSEEIAAHIPPEGEAPRNGKPLICCGEDIDDGLAASLSLSGPRVRTFGDLHDAIVRSSREPAQVCAALERMARASGDSKRRFSVHPPSAVTVAGKYGRVTHVLVFLGRTGDRHPADAPYLYVSDLLNLFALRKQFPHASFSSYGDLAPDSQQIARHFLDLPHADSVDEAFARVAAHPMRDAAQRITPSPSMPIDQVFEGRLVAPGSIIADEPLDHVEEPLSGSRRSTVIDAVSVIARAASTLPRAAEKVLVGITLTGESVNVSLANVSPSSGAARRR